MSSTPNLAQQVMDRVDELARLSDEPDRLTRGYGSAAMRQVNGLVGSWLREAGLTVSEDAFGNLIGRVAGTEAQGKTFLLGSHLDTARGAGKFDGALGVLLGIASVAQLHQNQTRLPYSLAVVGFADSQGARFGIPHLGGKIMAGAFDERDLKRSDARGISLADAIRTFGGDPARLDSARRNPQHTLGFAEVRLEHGPVLEKKDQPAGVVSAIAGQTQITVRFTGQTGHAGTTPMALRHDALAAAAQFLIAVETGAKAIPGLLATVGQLDVQPGAREAIPGEATLHLDLRHESDATRTAAGARFHDEAVKIGEQRGVTVDWELLREIESVPCSRELSGLLGKAARRQLLDATEFPTGTQHDAGIMGAVTPAAMLLLRSHPGAGGPAGDSVTIADVRTALAVLNDFLLLLGNQLHSVPRKSAA